MQLLRLLFLFAPQFFLNIFYTLSSISHCCQVLAMERIVCLHPYSVSVHESPDPGSHFTGKQDYQAGEELRSRQTNTHTNTELGSPVLT